MRLLDTLRFRLATLFRRSVMREEMGEELGAHIQLRADDLERSGVPRAEAQRRARMEFGPLQGVREDCHEAAGGTFIESVFQDLRLALRLLRKSPGFTFVAVGTLALAIGANAVVFAALNAVVLKPLNVPRPETLYSIHRSSDHAGALSYPSYRDLRERNTTFEDLAAYNPLQVGLDTGDVPHRAWIQVVTGNYFDVLGVQPLLGRFFHAADERGPNSAPYLVLSHAFWHSHFHDDRSVIGRVVQVNKHPYTIIGVAPPAFNGTLMFFTPDFFVPMVNQPQLDGVSVLDARNKRWIFQIFGHLKSGVTPEQAAADINSAYGYLVHTYPADHGAANYALARPSLYGDFMGRPVRNFLGALMLLAGLILLAACANLGSLFAARAADRSREVALRLALGAGRIRILRQLFTEAIVIALAGGALGLWGSIELLRWIRLWNPIPQFPINLPLHPDANVYLVALLLALASGFLFGAVPVRQVLHTDPYEIVKSGSRATPGRRFTVRDALVVAQIAICAVLVTSSFVAVRGLVRSMHSDFGFQPKNAMLVETVLEMAGYQGDAVPPLQKRMLEAVQTIPGVSAVALVDWPPLFNGSLKTAHIYRDETPQLIPANAAVTSVTYAISPEYFRVAETALHSGRAFTWHDDERAPRVAIVNREFARRLFGSEPGAMGRVFKLKDGVRRQVVGIAEDGKYQSLTEDPRPAVFLSLLQEPLSETSMVVRSERDPQQLAAAIRAKLREIDAGLPSYIQTWDQALSLVLFPSRVAAVSLGILGIMGAMLSITGIFGLAAYSVSRRLKELGIRMALGAQRKEVLQAALGRAFRLLAFGSAAGLVVGILASRVLAAVVYQATPRDPVVLGGVVFAMLLLGLIATWLPAQRALSIDPLALLREE